MTDVLGWILTNKIKLIGAFFAIEGGANLVWWYFNPPNDPTNATMQTVWEVGRVLRVILGVVLVLFG